MSVIKGYGAPYNDPYAELAFTVETREGFTTVSYTRTKQLEAEIKKLQQIIEEIE